MTPSTSRVTAARHYDSHRRAALNSREILLKIARLAMRLARSFMFRARRIFSLDRARLIRRNLLFPLRNALLRNRPISLSASGECFVLAPRGAIPLDIWAGRYSEKHELDLILSALRPGATFVDVGANVGFFSIPAAKRIQHGRVFAFEPTAFTFDALRHNAALNKLTNLHSFCYAVSDFVGEAALSVNAKDKDGLNTLGKPVHSDAEVVERTTVPVTTLDRFLAENSIAHVDVMKIDVEGGELFVLRGARDLLARSAPLILFECGRLSAGFAYHPVEPFWLLQQHGYSLYAIDTKSGRISRLVSSPVSDTNLIAIRPQHPCFALIEDRVK
jgi:FkbM family methyltransferase